MVLRAVFVCYALVMAKAKAERNTVGNWSIKNDPSFDDHLGRVARRKAQKSEALRRIRNIVAPNVKVWKIYGEWCVVTRAGEIAITSSDWLTAWKWTQRMYGRPF